MRLDQYIATTYAFTRNKAQALISAGLVSVNEKTITRTSYEVSGEEDFLIQVDKRIQWVSRSAGKLDGFFREIGVIEIDWKNCLDIGSSTGGFTQILLERWAHHIDAVDVGTDQLHETIKKNPRVTSYEQMDIRKFSPKQYDIIVCDVSFISLRDIIPELERFAGIDTEIFLLFKPQFEVGREHLRKTGVPKDKKIVEQKLGEFELFLVEQGFHLIKKSPATVIGEAGNEEWMMRINRKS